MKGIKCEELEDYGKTLQCSFSCNVNDQHIYIHWDCWAERKPSEWYKHIFEGKEDKAKLSFIEYIYYALLHEDLHLILYILGEETYKIKEKENIIHCDIINRVIISIATERHMFYYQKKLDRWFK